MLPLSKWLERVKGWLARRRWGKARATARPRRPVPTRARLWAD